MGSGLLRQNEAHAPGRRDQHAPRRWAPRLILPFAAVFALMEACASTTARGAPPDFKGDFPIVAYQGAEALGGQESTLLKVLGQGKPVILNFWAGQCPPCRAEMPAFQKLADEFHRDVVFVGVDVGVFTGLGTHDDARRLLSDLGIRYPAAYAVDATPLRLNNVRSMPTTFFLTPKGQVVERVDGMLLEAQLRSSVQKLLAASSRRRAEVHVAGEGLGGYGR